MLNILSQTQNDYTYTLAVFSLTVFIVLFSIFFLINYLTEHPLILILDGLIWGFLFIITIFGGNYYWRIIGLGENWAKYILIIMLSIFCLGYFILGRIIRKSTHLLYEGCVYLFPLIGFVFYFQFEFIIIISIFTLILIILIFPIMGEFFSLIFFITMVHTGKEKFLTLFGTEFILLGFITTFFIALSIHIFQLNDWKRHSSLLIICYLLPMIMLVSWLWESFPIFLIFLFFIFIFELLIFALQPNIWSLIHQKIKFQAEEKDLKELRLYRFFIFLSKKIIKFLQKIELITNNLYSSLKKIGLYKLGRIQFIIPVIIGIALYLIVTEIFYPIFIPLRYIRVGNIIIAANEYPEYLFITCVVIFTTMALTCFLVSVVWFIIYTYQRIK